MPGVAVRNLLAQEPRHPIEPLLRGAASGVEGRLQGTVPRQDPSQRAQERVRVPPRLEAVRGARAGRRPSRSAAAGEGPSRPKRSSRNPPMAFTFP